MKHFCGYSLEVSSTNKVLQKSDLWPYEATKLTDGTSSRFRVEDRKVLVGMYGLSKSLMLAGANPLSAL